MRRDTEMNISHVDEGTLHSYLDGELAPEEARGVAAHLTQCAACRNRLDEERALIARAGELLALATPPDRQTPPFRAGDLKPPARLWWRVRVPLAWAATVVLALGIGMYVGGGAPVRPDGEPVADGYADLAARAPLASAIAPDTAAATSPVPRPAPQRARAAPASSSALPATPAPPAPPAPLAARERRQVRAAAPLAAWAQGDTLAEVIARDSVRAEAARADEGVLVAATAESAPVSLSLDSARALLGQDPVALPELPIRAVRRERAIGETVVVVEQELDSATVIELRERRPVPAALEAVVVSGAAESQAFRERAAQDSVAAGKARFRAAAPPALLRADSPSALRQAQGRGRIVREQGRPVLHLGHLLVEISGPLAADSLEKLLERVRPVRP
jgi:putative zinc finger protein